MRVLSSAKQQRQGVYSPFCFIIAANMFRSSVTFSSLCPFFFHQVASLLSPISVVMLALPWR